MTTGEALTHAALAGMRCKQRQEGAGWPMNEHAVLDGIQRLLATPWMDTFMVAISMLGNAGVVWIALGITLACTRTYRLAGIAVILAVALGALASECLLKPIFMRDRPFLVQPPEAMLVSPPFGTSFPSGHTTAAFASFGALLAARMPRRMLVPVGLFALVMGFSRFYLYVHYPTDVAAGIAVGLLVGCAAWLMVAKAVAWRSARPGRVRLGKECANQKAGGEQASVERTVAQEATGRRGGAE